MKIDVKTLDASAAGSIELNEAVFGVAPRADILYRMVSYQLAKRQAGTHRTKPRSEIRRTGKKFGRQKGGGTARHGNRRSNIFVGGGRAHGPVVRSHAIDLPKKVRALALKMALSDKAASKDIIVIEDAKAKTAKTVDLQKAFTKLGFDNALIIGGTTLDDNFNRAARNISHVDVLPQAGINVYDILRRKKLVLTKAALAGIEERFQ